jgi:hypothetical protein
MLTIDFPEENRGKVIGYIFRAWRRHPKTGEKLWAKDYGLRAWRIPIFAAK